MPLGREFAFTPNWHDVVVWIISALVTGVLRRVRIVLGGYDIQRPVGRLGRRCWQVRGQEVPELIIPPGQFCRNGPEGPASRRTSFLGTDREGLDS